MKKKLSGNLYALLHDNHVVSNHSNNVVINLSVTELTLCVAPPKMFYN